jgi:D-inositol-3-phosphate glycosyltransferase
MVDLPVLGLVVPSLEKGGGVPAVARFVLAAAQRDGRYRIQPISLATSSADSCSTRLLDPRTWLRGATMRGGEWQGLRLRHVGASWTDFEFQRYQPRKALAAAVADCDVLQVVSGSPAWANAVVGLGKPVALQVATRARVERRRRDASPRSFAAWWRKGMTEFTDRIDDRALRSVDAIQVENPWMLDYARQLNKGRIVDLRYAPPGVDTAVYCPVPTPNLQIEPYVLCVGRLDDPRKNIGLLLEAYALLSPGLRNAMRLVLAGMGRPPATFWQRVGQLGLESRVEFIHRPSREALVSLYQQATVFGLSSDEEGLGVVLLEAMACAVPVVATRCGGPDGIITDGKDGFLVPLDDAAAMAERLAHLLTDRQRNQQMGREARATIEARYADTVTGQAFVDMWDKLLAKTGKF